MEKTKNGPDLDWNRLRIEKTEWSRPRMEKT
jgi:hypothetical protein